MVKRVRVLGAIDDEADVPYEATRLARQALRARPRLAALVAIGALVATLEAVATARWLWLAPAIALAATAWSVKRGRLGGVIAGALAAIVAVGVSLWGVFATSPSPSDLVAWLVALALGIGALPDVLVLVRDAELQNTYGLWARRE